MSPQQVVSMARNGWTASIGIHGRHSPDYALTVSNTSFLSLIRSRRGRGVLNFLLHYYALPGKITLLGRFYAQFVRRGNLCFDLGAHVGNRVRAFSRLEARTGDVYARLASQTRPAA